MGRHRVWVGDIAAFVDPERLLGSADFEIEAAPDGSLVARGELDTAAAADLQARLRGVGIGGRAVCVEVQPPLARRDVRAARTAEARRMRKGSVGLSRAGARLDEEARYSLTPEALALSLGRDAVAMGVRRVIDACCGAGGNAIGFARAGARVIAVDADAGRLAMARHNAALYGVADAIELRRGDARALVPDLEGDLLFVDPPWTRDYDRTRVTLDALPLLGALWEQRRRVQLWAKVPPSFDPDTAPGVTRVRAVFGAADGDRRRVKFLVLEASAD